MPDENLATPQEGTNPEPEVEVTETTTDEVTEETPAEVEEETVSKSQFNQVLARAKKAEAMLKAKPKPDSIKSTLTAEDVEVRILKAEGMTDELIGELKAIAKARGKESIIEAKSDPIFLAIKREREETEKAQKAKLPASKGSGSVKKGKDFTTPGLTDEEHKQLWRDSQGR